MHVLLLVVVLLVVFGLQQRFPQVSCIRSDAARHTKRQRVAPVAEGLRARALAMARLGQDFQKTNESSRAQGGQQRKPGLGAQKLIIPLDSPIASCHASSVYLYLSDT